MTYGVAAYKVTPEFCEAELNDITSIGGITIKYNCTLGKDVQLAELQKKYYAVFLGIGVGVAVNWEFREKIQKVWWMLFRLSITYVHKNSLKLL